MYENYCKIRDLKGYKDAEVARFTGITKSTFSDWKSGRSCPKNDKLQKIANFLEVSVDYLTTGKEPTEASRPIIDYSVRFGNNEFLLEMMEKAEKLEDEHDKELILTMLNTMINKNKGKK